MTNWTKTEEAHAKEVSWDMDLMNMAREYVGLEATAYQTQEVLDKVHDEFPGGISQFYLQNRF